MKKQTKVAIVACSNAQPHANREKLAKLEAALSELGLVPIFGDYIYEKESIFSGTGKERAESLMRFYRDPEIQAIFDISGGDIANEILPFHILGLQRPDNGHQRNSCKNRKTVHTLPDS